MDINYEYESSDTTQYKEAFQMYMENEYCTIQRGLPILKPKSTPSNNIFPSTMTSISIPSTWIKMISLAIIKNT
jgi:hypothetical protein